MVDEKYLLREYVKNRRSLEDIAKETNSSRSSIHRLVKKYKLRKNPSMPSVSRDYLFREFIQKNRSAYEIADEIHRDFTTVYNYLKRYNIKKPEPTLVGKRFGKLLVISRTGLDKHHHRKWECKCDCGKIKEVLGTDLIRGITRSCSQSCGWVGNRKKAWNWSGYGDLHGSYLTRTKAGAKSRGLKYNLSAKYLWELYEKQNKKCALTGLQIDFAKSSAEFCRGEITASLDRIDNEKGYIRGNVQWIHKDVNRSKTNLSQNRFIEICNLVSKKSKTL